MYSLPTVSALEYTANAVWIQNESWTAMQKEPLTNNLEKVVSDLGNNHIEFAFVFVGYWQPPATIGYLHDDVYWTTVIDALHSVGVKAIAWAESYNTLMDPRAEGDRQLIYDAVVDCMNKGFDGYNDDIESTVAEVTTQDMIDYWNGLTPLLHSMNPPRLNMPDVGYDWRQDTNPYLHVDYIVTMFYSSQSRFEDFSQGHLYWQENFGVGQYPGLPPASPLILGVMNYYGNNYPLAWQLSKASEWISTYGAPNLVGFSFWLYEYMGTNPYDWEQWNYWITRASPPSLNTVTIKASPTSRIPITFKDVTRYTPDVQYVFSGTSITVTAPYEVESESSSVLFGASDHTGGQEGYNVYTYASGPYELNFAASVNSVYIYTPVAGNVKLAIYSSTTYTISGWVGTNEHPYMRLTQSQPTPCTANSWNLISCPTATLSAGIYFIVIKGDTTGIIGVSGLPPKSVGGEIYGYDQFITQGYNTPFDEIFPQVEGAMGNDASVYVPTAEPSVMPYYFVQWDDGSTSQTRTIDVNSDVALTVYYATTSPPPQPPPATPPLIILLSVIGACCILIGGYKVIKK